MHSPTIYFTDLPFIHSRSILASNGSCNECECLCTMSAETIIIIHRFFLRLPLALCWTADSQSFEILINGLKRGVSPKHRYREKARYIYTYRLLLSFDHPTVCLVDQECPGSHFFIPSISFWSHRRKLL